MELYIFSARLSWYKVQLEKFGFLGVLAGHKLYIPFQPISGKIIFKGVTENQGTELLVLILIRFLCRLTPAGKYSAPIYTPWISLVTNVMT